MLLAGGIAFAAIEAAGLAVEIVYPATAQRFGTFDANGAFVVVSLTLSAWLYHFCQIGASVMVLATSLIALDSGVYQDG